MPRPINNDEDETAGLGGAIVAGILVWIAAMWLILSGIKS